MDTGRERREMKEVLPFRNVSFHPATTYDDRAGGGERRVLLMFNSTTKIWEGELDTPLDGTHRWKVAVKSWDVPPLRGDNHMSSLRLQLLHPYVVDAVLMLNHNSSSIAWGAHLRGQASRLTWYPVEEEWQKHKRLSKVTAVISTVDGQVFEPMSGGPHLVLDFAIDE